MLLARWLQKNVPPDLMTANPSHLAGARVTLDPLGSDDVGHDLLVVDHGTVPKPDHMCFVAHEAIIGPADTSSLAEAIRDDRRCCYALPESVMIATGPLDQFDETIFDPGPVHIEVSETAIEACIETIDLERRLDPAGYRALLETVVSERGCIVTVVRLKNEYGEVPEQDDSWPKGFEADRQAWLDKEASRPRYVEVRIAPLQPMKVAQMLAAGHDAYALLTAAKGGGLTAATTAQLVRSGYPHLVLGLEESQWLEVKAAPYNLQAPSAHAAIELAQDIARFANAEVPAVLIVGIASAKRNGFELLTELKPSKLSSFNPEQYRAVIDARVYPTIEGLRIDVVELEGQRGLLVIEIPLQPIEYRPFLVHGAIVEGRVEGAFISIVRRRGEGSTAVTASQIHAALAAGQALLRSHPAEPT